MCKPSGSTESTSPVQLIAAELVPESEYKQKMDDENTVHVFEDTFLSTKTIDSKPDETERETTASSFGKLNGPSWIPFHNVQ